MLFKTANALAPASRRHRGLAGLLLAGLLLAALPAPASAQQTHLAVAGYGTSKTFELELNKSIIVDLPADVAEVIVSQPQVAGTVMRSTRRAVVQGTGPGDTNIFFLDAAGRTISVLDIKVTKEPSQVGSALEAALARILPGSAIQVESVTLNDSVNRVVLSGTVLSGDDVERAGQVAVQFAGGPENVANLVTINGSQQVMLKVTVAEVSREAVKQFGINLSATIGAGGLTTGIISNQPLGGATNVVANSSIGVGLNVGNVALEASLRALERQGGLRTLAEPNLTAISGQPAEFLAGGEFPVPTNVDDDGNVTYTFKEFGVKLAFTPTVKSNGKIVLAVDTSVSEPSSEGAFSAGTITIPGTRERMAKTTVELHSGMTLAIAGLMEDEVRQQINQLPGLGNIPILGALFRSRDFIHSQTELLILVTPYLVEPSPYIPTPVEGVAIASDAEAIFLGHMEKTYGVGGGDGMRGSFSGSVGFVLD
ncbi:type II and III secretion system protein family protein [Devosia nitrariae]|uniref:Secretin n=1 Tax=Devosia nitrariae TaxID=2071872 RepID=A0ABQ5VZM6_9HYPH|nr:type II and III secretion system protein family protein [Devosia nitrariae]GLQ53259.1 secretin [Devosia nitrariae]